MKKKNIFRNLAVAFVATAALTACDKSNPQMDQKPENANKTAVAGELKIAYVEVDSIMSQYKFCKEYSLILQKKGQNIQNTLAKKQEALQAAVANFQQKVQQNAYTREQAEAINAGLQKQGNDLQVLNQRLSTEFQNETDKFNKALRDSIQHYLAVYNKDKKYDAILYYSSNFGMGSGFYFNPALDITKEVIDGLNARYNAKHPAAKEGDKKDDKKDDSAKK